MAETNIVFNDENKNKEDEIDDLDLSSSEENPAQNKGGVVLNKSQLTIVRNLLMNMRDSADKLSHLLGGQVSPEDEARISIGQVGEVNPVLSEEEIDASGSRIVEGVFDGENMIGPDGKEYSVPANYASKSKLVEGDILKLTITANGTFIYKQIGPIERNRIVGTLKQSDSGGYIVEAEEKHWRVLTASVTYFKGQVGDEIIILVPKSGNSKWAAVENIVRSKD